MKMITSKKAQGWSDLKKAFLYAALMVILLSIAWVGLKSFEESANSCKGVCSNNIVKVVDDTGKELDAYEQYTTCYEVTQKLGKEYQPSAGKCSAGAECCLG